MSDPPKSYCVDVTVNPNTIQVSEDHLIMNQQDDVCWRSTNGRGFTIRFEGFSLPFESRAMDHVSAARPRRAGLGKYKYTVVSADDPGLELDPIIEVVDPSKNP